MKHFIARKWQRALFEQGLVDFDSFWNLQLPLLDNPNENRGGWSTVSQLSLQMHDKKKEKKRFIVKRQQGHTSFTFCHPIHGIPTFEKEFSNILRYQRLGLPTITPVYYARRNSSHGLQAVLVTEYLDGFVALSELNKTWEKEFFQRASERRSIIKALAHHIKELHLKGLQHNCLYPKHLFIQKKPGEIQIKFIDLENTKWRPFGNWRKIRDLDSLYRRIKGWSRTDCLLFFKTYCGGRKLDKKSKRLCRQILKRRSNKLHI